MTKQIINKKLLDFFKATPQDFEIIYTINCKKYVFYERYLGTQIKFFVDEKEYDHVDMDGRYFICKTSQANSSRQSMYRYLGIIQVVKRVCILTQLS